MENNENMIEWLTNQHTITCSFTQTKWINKAKALAKKHQNKVKIVKENKDGSLIVKMPIKALKLSIIERELTDEQREKMSKAFKERMNK